MQCSKTAPARALAGRGAAAAAPNTPAALAALGPPQPGPCRHSSSRVLLSSGQMGCLSGRPSPAARSSPAAAPRQAHAGDSPLVLPEKKELRLVTPKYCESIYQTRRRPTRTIEVRRGRGAGQQGSRAGAGAGSGARVSGAAPADAQD